MANVVQDFIDAEIAQLQRLVPLQVAPYGYGSDLSCATDLTEDMAETDPESVQGIAEMLVRFLTVERDSVPDAPGRGFNIYRLVREGQTPESIRTAQAQIVNEATEDDRIETATCTITVAGLKKLDINVRCTPVDKALGNFELVLGVTPDDVLFNLVQGAA